MGNGRGVRASGVQAQRSGLTPAASEQQSPHPSLLNNQPSLHGETTNRPVRVTAIRALSFELDSEMPAPATVRTPMCTGSHERPNQSADGSVAERVVLLKASVELSSWRECTTIKGPEGWVAMTWNRRIIQAATAPWPPTTVGARAAPHPLRKAAPPEVPLVGFDASRELSPTNAVLDTERPPHGRPEGCRRHAALAAPSGARPRRRQRSADSKSVPHPLQKARCGVFPRDGVASFLRGSPPCSSSCAGEDRRTATSHVTRRRRRQSQRQRNVNETSTMTSAVEDGDFRRRRGAPPRPLRGGDRGVCRPSG